MTQRPQWAAYTTFAHPHPHPQRPENPFAQVPVSVFSSTQHQQPRTASISPMYECEPPVEGRPDSLDGLVADLYNKFTTLETVRGVAESPPPSLAAQFEVSRRSTIREENELGAHDQSMRSASAADSHLVYNDEISGGYGEGARICSMADVSTLRGHVDDDDCGSEGSAEQDQNDLYSAMSLGD